MASVAQAGSTAGKAEPFVSKWSDRYRGATVEDLDPPAALSLTPSDTVGQALNAAFERDFTHLTVVDGTTRALLGYVSMPQLQKLLETNQVTPEDTLGGSAAMTRFGFKREGRAYRVITMQTPLELLEAFFAGAMTRGEAQQFAVITDERRRFVLGVATAADLEKFVNRRPA
ncbi:hypothetical protein SBRCBS47491_002304 [Sporothrix bragantina]|uniref:CBS domain-containing protein n=1 Tax=Sporothrix bragantina TaxID=671064 RepID=A0ABP0B5W2_9PEZI